MYALAILFPIHFFFLNKTKIGIISLGTPLGIALLARVLAEVSIWLGLIGLLAYPTWLVFWIYSLVKTGSWVDEYNQNLKT